MLKQIAMYLMRYRHTARLILWLRKKSYERADKRTSKMYFQAQALATKAINERLELGIKPSLPSEGVYYPTGRYDYRTPRYERRER